jgi:hypothetical protein
MTSNHWVYILISSVIHHRPMNKLPLCVIEFHCSTRHNQEATVTCCILAFNKVYKRRLTTVNFDFYKPHVYNVKRTITIYTSPVNADFNKHIQLLLSDVQCPLTFKLGFTLFEQFEHNIKRSVGLKQYLYQV